MEHQHPEEWTEIDHPIELECEHGHHLVLDPHQVRTLANQRRFRCARCGERKKRAELAALTTEPSGKVRGICAACEIQLQREEETE